jgi:hypothetical protein
MIEYSIKGYHGTDTAHLQSIIDNNFEPSLGDSHWLGTGAYFFVDGYPDSISSIDAAAKWAEAEAWNKNLNRYDYKNYCILEAVIELKEDNFLDLTTEEGMKVFNYYRQRLVKSMRKTNFKMKSTSPIFRDGELINKMRSEDGIRIDAVKAYFYFKFKEERILNADFRLPNCTVVSVFEPKKNINKSSIKSIRKFRIL